MNARPTPHIAPTETFQSHRAIIDKSYGPYIFYSDDCKHKYGQKYRNRFTFRLRKVKLGRHGTRISIRVPNQHCINQLSKKTG